MYQVIIIEDDPMVASINRTYVELNRNLKVAGVFSNGQDALAYLEKNPADLAIMDFYMPIMNGLELLREIRKRNKTLDIIMVTAANDAVHIKQPLKSVFSSDTPYFCPCPLSVDYNKSSILTV